MRRIIANVLLRLVLMGTCRLPTGATEKPHGMTRTQTPEPRPIMADSMPFRAVIPDPCDRHPSARAMTVWYRTVTRAYLVLCAHCTNAHDVELTSQGFELSIDNRAELVPHDRLMGAL